tara:strand:+ start:64 stop:357 length:294 start_codon:yes stop_codon:yes gene_type:complete
MKSSLNKWGNVTHEIEFNQIGPTNLKNNEHEQRRRIEEVRTEITRINRQLERYKEQVNRLRNLEQEVLKIIESCEPKWFGYYPKGVTKLNHILYYIS